MHLTRHQTPSGPRWAVDGHWLPKGFRLDVLLRYSYPVICGALAGARTGEPAEGDLLSPIEDGQEVWAAGVTYLRSREARMAESGTADVYGPGLRGRAGRGVLQVQRVAVAGHRGRIRVRPDSSWDVPEPELALVLNGAGAIVGYAAGNDVSSRSIEGENPLYLPQAKVYNGSCALGPGIVVAEADAMRDLPIRLVIDRAAVRRSTARPAPRSSSVRSRRSRSGSSPISTSRAARSS